MTRTCSGTEELVLRSTLDELERLDRKTMECTRSAGLGEEEAMMVAIAVIEAATNAIIHGNKYADDKTVIVRYDCAPGKVEVTVHDEGPGFDVSCVPDPTDPEQFMKCSGRGIFIMREVMDTVEFDMAEGTTVKMTKLV